MAMSDEIREQRKKLKGKGIKAHIAWFWEYERVTTLIVLVVAGIAISLIYHFVTNKPYGFGVMFLNAVSQDDQQTTLAEGFMDYAGIDSSSEDVLADVTETLTPGDSSSSEYDMYTTMKIMAEISAEQIDVAIMDAWYFDYYAYQGEFLALNEVLDEAALEQYKDRLYYIDQAEADRRQEAQDNLSSSTEGATETSAEGDTDAAAGSTDSADAAAADSEDVNSALAYGTQSEEEIEARASESLENFTLPDPDTMEEPVAVGIWCNDAPYIQENGNYDYTACIYGIVANTKQPERCQQFLEYLYQK